MTTHKGRPNFAPRYSVADFFCGCGGLSLGFSLTGRFDVVLGTDIKPDAITTFAKNHAKDVVVPIAIQDDIRVLGERRVIDALSHHQLSRVGDLDCLIGGPPCEGFSQNRSLGAGGKAGSGAASRVDKFIDDPRNHLFKWFVELAAKLQPAVLLIENVPDLVRHKDGATRHEILEALANAGYVVSVRVLNAADFGVPQMRRRAFFLGQRRTDLERTGIRLSLPTPTHKPYIFTHDDLDGREDWLPGDSGYWTTVREALDDLPSPAKDDDFDHSAASYRPARLTSLRRFLRTSDGSVPFNHIERKLGKQGLMRVQSLKAGQRVTELPEALRPKSSFHYSYSRLRWSEPARTITKFVYHVGSGMFTHPELDRALTMREAARLQTFPDDFRFHSTSIRDTSALIGSAVPPLLAQAIGREVVQYLDQLRYFNLEPEYRAVVRSQPTDAVLKRLEKERWGTDRSESQLGLAIGARSAINPSQAEDDESSFAIEDGANE